ncbi:MAG: hypothetical protein M9887_00740 [Chitinophagales bacterium]|nr:hypothetical protein [Chitinophagales bacterium]
MKDTYKSLLSMLVGWCLLSFITKIEWISYIAVALAFGGLISERFAEKFMKIVHKIIHLVFNSIQKILLAIVYYLVITPIALMKKNETKEGNFWHIHKNTTSEQLKKLW